MPVAELAPMDLPVLKWLGTTKIPDMREKIFAALYETIEGLSDERLAKLTGTDIEFLSLILADACVEGELIKVVEVLDEVITEHPGEELPVHLSATIRTRYRLSYEKWVEMEAAA